MASVFLPRNQNLLSNLLLFILCSTVITSSSSAVILHWKNVSLSFEDMGANFAPPVNPSGECGMLYLADPLDACLPLSNEVRPTGNSSSPFVLIVRGGCGFEDKVRRAQKAGFKAAIVYDNENSGNLITMAGNSVGIDILAVFISKASGENLRNYVGLDNEELWLIPSLDNSAWSLITISIICLLSISAVLAVCFFLRRHSLTYQMPQLREFHGMSSKLVKAMPSFVFTKVLDCNSTSVTCAICLEDYNVGDKIRILPCKHKFHSFCVDCWLTAWRTFCPVCKQDAKTRIAVAPASESTPLLSPVLSSIAASPLSTARSSSAIQIIASASPGSHLSSLANHSISTNSGIPRPALSHQHHTPPLVTISQSFMDVHNLSGCGSFARMGLLHSSSFRYPSMSPQNSQYLLSPYSHASIQASSGYLSGHSNQHLNLLHYTESSPSCLSPYVSAQSLPGC